MERKLYSTLEPNPQMHTQFTPFFDGAGSYPLQQIKSVYSKPHRSITEISMDAN